MADAASIAQRQAAALPLGREVTAELLARHDVRGPRYTSYPTAVEFHGGVTAADYEERLARAGERHKEPLSVYVHLPFCRERCLFCGCNVIITPHLDKAQPYLDLLRSEMASVAQRLPRRRRIAQLHLGGGTPTYFVAPDLTALVGDLFGLFPPLEGAELAIEVDPRVTTGAHIDALADLGFNRISLGVQDLTPRVQQAVRRVQSLEQTRRVVDKARDRGFGGINVDLIYGLPHQTPQTFEATVEAVIEMRVERAAVYSFAFVPWIHGHQKQLPEAALPSRETKHALFALARERFLGAGYEPIGMDHFARPGDELVRARRDGCLQRNFQGYTVLPGSDVVGLGISAIGDVGGGYFQNTKKLSRYRDAVAAGRLPIERGILRGPDDDLRREVIQALMCNFEVRPRAIEAAWAIDFEAYFAEDLERLREHEREGLVEIGADSISATAPGRLFVRNLAMCFDRYLEREREAAQAATFSRTV